MDEYNKIYARINANGVVVDIFSEAFKTPTENDICINATNTDRHGAQRYKVYDENDIANYAIINSKLDVRDKTAELSRIKNKIEYPKLVKKKKKKKYSVSAEFAILRQRNSKPEEFAEYNAFCELCKSEAKNELNIGVQNYASTIY